MEQLLPRVRDGTLASVTRSIFEEYGTDGKFIETYIRHLKKVNPNICQTIMTLVSDLEPEDFVRTTFYLCTLYKILESEAEAQKFEQEMEG